MNAVSANTPLSDDEMAVLVIAIELLLAPTRVIGVASDVTPAWRFSGRAFGSPRRYRS